MERHLLLVQEYLPILFKLKLLSPGCETAISTGTITVEESASINIIDDNPTGSSFCDGEDFNGAKCFNY